MIPFTFNMSEDEDLALSNLAIEQDLSKEAVLRQGLRLYQMMQHRLRDGETFSFSGDRQRAEEFAGGEVPTLRERFEDRARELLINNGGKHSSNVQTAWELFREFTYVSQPEQRWHKLDEAPLGTTGLVWSKEMPDRDDLVGTVYAYGDGGRYVSSSSARGVEFSLWHPFPALPQQEPNY